jgi:hypothetical protein
MLVITASFIRTVSLLVSTFAAFAALGDAAGLRGSLSAGSEAKICNDPAGNLSLDISGNTTGTCPESRTSMDPRVFGPIFWPMLHTMSVNYPEVPNLEAAKACTKFIMSLPWLIPCDHCGHDFHEFIRLNINFSNKSTGDGDTPDCGGRYGDSKENRCLSPRQACKAGRADVVSFFARAHNNVNTHTHPCRGRWTMREVLASYANRTGTCLKNIVWGTCKIPRNAPGSKVADASLPCDQSGGANHDKYCCNEESLPIPTDGSNEFPDDGSNDSSPDLVEPADDVRATSIHASGASSKGSSVCKNPAGNLSLDISGATTGTCPVSRTSMDPRVFGPIFWPMLHTMSVNYPEVPNFEAAKACTKFIMSLPWLIPCDHCGHDFHEFIRLNINFSNKSTGDGDTPDCGGKYGDAKENRCLSPWEACKAGRAQVVSFFARTHNNVNIHTHPCRRRWAVTDVLSVYTSQTGKCLSNIVWGTCTIPRSAPSSKGTETSLPCDQSGGENHDKYCCDEESSLIPEVRHPSR